jgi:hypothetical protein
LGKTWRTTRLSERVTFGTGQNLSQSEEERQEQREENDEDDDHRDNLQIGMLSLGKCRIS